MTKIKICGLTRQADAELAAELGADALGFILEPTSPRNMRQKLGIDLFLDQLPVFLQKVAVFGRLGDLPSGFNLVQYVLGDPTNLVLPRLPVVRIEPEDSDEVLSEKLNRHKFVLVDPFSKDSFGGTGKKVDWEKLSRVSSSVTTKLVLAGGLTPENVAEAIDKVRPYAVDVSSGVEKSPGIKDRVKLRDFIQAVKEN